MSFKLTNEQNTQSVDLPFSNLLFVPEEPLKNGDYVLYNKSENSVGIPVKKWNDFEDTVTAYIIDQQQNLNLKVGYVKKSIDDRPELQILTVSPQKIISDRTHFDYGKQVHCVINDKNEVDLCFCIKDQMPRRSIFWWLNHRFLEFFKEHEDILVKDGLLYNSQPVSQVVSENAKKIREMSNLLKAVKVEMLILDKSVNMKKEQEYFKNLKSKLSLSQFKGMFQDGIPQLLLGGSNENVALAIKEIIEKFPKASLVPNVQVSKLTPPNSQQSLTPNSQQNPPTNSQKSPSPTASTSNQKRRRIEPPTEEPLRNSPRKSKSISRLCRDHFVYRDCRLMDKCPDAHKTKVQFCGKYMQKNSATKCAKRCTNPHLEFSEAEKKHEQLLNEKSETRTSPRKESRGQKHDEVTVIREKRFDLSSRLKNRSDIQQKSIKICKFFASGFCRDGQKCIFGHVKNDDSD